MEGCADWLQALQWMDADPVPQGIDWCCQWVKMNTLIVRCGYLLHEDSETWEVARFARDFRRQFYLQKYVAKAISKGRWIDVVRDDWEVYASFWKDGKEESQKKRRHLETSRGKWWLEEEGSFPAHAPMLQVVERRSVWDQ